MSAAEQKVAQYVLDHGADVLSCTVTELAEKSGVSDATVVRFSRSVGYKGFQDLKIHLAQDTIQPVQRPSTSFSEGDNVEELVAKVVQSEIETLEETLTILNMKDVEEISRIILARRRVVFFGTGGSILVAQDAMHKFLKIGVKSVVQMDTDIQKMESALLTAEDAAIGISHSGSNSHVIECLKNAKARGAATIGLTTVGKSPMQRVCDYTVMTATKELVFRSESTSARIAQLAVLDGLVAVMSYMDYQRASSAIQETRQATSGGKS